MKTFLFAFFLILGIATSSLAKEWKPIRSNQPVAASVELISSDISTSVIKFSLEGFFLNQVKTSRGVAYTISLGETTPMLDKDAPDMPKMTTSVIIPDAAMMDIEEVSSNFVEYTGIEIAPSKGNLTRDIDPSAVPFEYGRTYSENAFYPGTISGLRDPFILRDYRGQTVIAYPFQYNPVTKVLRVYTEITLKLKTISNQGYNVLNRSAAPSKIDKDFSKAYQNVFINTTSNDYTPLDDYGRMLVICHPGFMEAMQPFVIWKNTMGIKTEMVDVTTIGTTPGAIKSYVLNYYNTNGLTFLLIVGDAPQIPTNTGGGLGGPSDNAYGYLVGNDHYPDIFVGRFSAENVEHVNTMVQRTLEYETSPLVTTNWFDKGFGIASSEGPGDDNEYDYTHMRNIRTDLVGYTYSSVAELYDGSQGGEDQPGNPTPAMVTTEVNAGRSIINYVGHGSDNSWSTTGFSGSHVNALSNNHMWPFIWSVACVNGNFSGGTCFAEAWLRAKNADGPTGAIATLMSTINQSWNPPMDGQDEMDDILVESYPTNIKRTFGGLSMNGCYKMNETYGGQGDDMTDTWTLFGDPSVMVRTDMPEMITATHENQVFLGSTSMVINSPVEGALVALSLNNQFVTSAFVAGGQVTLTFPAYQVPDTLKLVITAYNYIPYIVDIPLIPNAGPYVIFNEYTLNDAAYNNNGMVDFGETIELDLALTNIGIENADNVHVTLSSNDQFITLVDSVMVYPVIPAHDTVVSATSFSFKTDPNIPDMHLVHFHYTAVAGTETWNGNFTLTAHSGILKLVSIFLDDTEWGNGNEKVDPGEKFTLAIDVSNLGTANTVNVNGQLSFNNPHLTVLSSSVQNYGNLATGQSNTGVFILKADQSTPNGEIIPVVFMMTANLGLQSSDVFNIVVGLNPVAVIDLDENHNSGPEILNALVSNNVFADYKTEMPADLSGRSTLFVCLGVGTKKHVLSTVEGQKLAAFLTAGGKLYMEGGDTWYRDPKTAVHPKFKTNGVSDGFSDLNIETGVDGQFAESLSFVYSGDKDFIDRLSAVAPAFSLFKNTTPSYISAAAYDEGTYRTIASSFEFGGLTDGDAPSTQNEYMNRIIQFFGIVASPYTANFMGNPINICDGGTVSFTDYSSPGTVTWAWSFPGGNPSTSTLPEPVVTYANPGLYDVTLTVNNGTTSNTLVKEDYVNVAYCTGIAPGLETEVNIFPNPTSGVVTIKFGGFTKNAELKITDAVGKIICSHRKIDASQDFSLDLSGISEGMYFLTITSEGKQVVKKIIIRK